MTNMFEFFCSCCTIVERGNTISNHDQRAALDSSTHNRHAILTEHTASSTQVEKYTVRCIIYNISSYIK